MTPVGTSQSGGEWYQSVITKAELVGLGDFEGGYYVRLIKGPIVDLVLIRLLERLWFNLIC